MNWIGKMFYCMERLSWRWYTLCFCAQTGLPLKKVTVVGGKINLWGPVQFELDGHVILWGGSTFWGDGVIHLGDNVSIGQNTILYASKEGGISIGENTQIAALCYLIDMDHGMEPGRPIITQKNSAQKIVIGRDVWIAAQATVLKGSRIEDGAVIGAKAVVKGKIPENAIAVGIPARVRRTRQEERTE